MSRTALPTPSFTTRRTSSLNCSVGGCRGRFSASTSGVTMAACSAWVYVKCDGLHCGFSSFSAI
eukprot:5707573-Pleurochrysis_carterae.AAC.1